MRIVYRYTFSYEQELENERLSSHLEYHGTEPDPEGNTIEEFANCNACLSDLNRIIVPESDGMIYLIWAIVKICIVEGRYDVTSRDLSGKT